MYADVLGIARAVPLDAVQLHGDESRRRLPGLAAEFEVIRALKVDADFSEVSAAQFAACRGLLLDAPSAGYGGAGESFRWEMRGLEGLRDALPAARLLAGRRPARRPMCAEAIAIAHPDVVDVCSGVESEKGIKSVREDARICGGRAGRGEAGAMKDQAVLESLLHASGEGYFGPYGGRFVAETLVEPLDELTAAFTLARQRSELSARAERPARGVQRPAHAVLLRRAAQRIRGRRANSAQA